MTKEKPEIGLPGERTPTQFYLEGDQEIFFIHDPERRGYVIDNEPTLRFIVTAHDSTAHLNWLPTRLRVETSQGYNGMMTLVPFACIVPKEELKDEEFPFNVEWWSCNHSCRRRLCKKIEKFTIN